MNKTFKKYIPIITFSLLVIIGLLIMLYPVISNFMNSNKAQVVINDYSDTIASNTSNKNTLLIEEARNYNKSLSTVDIVDAFVNPKENLSEEYKNILNVNSNGMMGYLNIPKIDIKVPIYHGTSDEVLQKGVGHLEGSSFPVGGESTHSVLSAHSGLPSARLFTDLNQLKIGDMFYIYILDEVFAYEVDQVLVVEPADVSELELQEGEDYVTLVTCTPYAVNTHRLLVRGTRVEYSPKVLESIPVETKLGSDDIILYVSLFIVFVILLLVIIFSIKGKKKKQIDTNTNININNNTAITHVEPINNNIISTQETFNNTSVVGTSLNPSTSSNNNVETLTVTNSNNTTINNEPVIINNLEQQNTFNEAKTEVTNEDTNNILL